MADAHLLKVKEGALPQSIERAEWAGAFAVRAYGLSIGVRATDPTYLPEARERLPYGWKPIESDSPEYLYSIVTGDVEAIDSPVHALFRNGAPLATETYRVNVLDELERNLRLLVAEHGRRRTFVHAGVVGWKGRAILIPGRSFSGKTTLIAELVRAGAIYYSDDFAVLDRRGRVHPFATPLQMRELWGGPQAKLDVEMLGGRAGKGPLPVGLIVFTSYKAGARWRPRVLTPGRAILELLDHTAAPPARAQETLSTLELAVSGATVLKGVRAEAAETARALLRQLGT